MLTLVSRWTRSRAAGLVAALLFAFHPIRLGNITHPTVWDLSFTVFALYFAERLFAEGLLGARGRADRDRNAERGLRAGGRRQRLAARARAPALAVALVALALVTCFGWPFVGQTRYRWQLENVRPPAARIAFFHELVIQRNDGPLLELLLELLHHPHGARERRPWLLRFEHAAEGRRPSLRLLNRDDERSAYEILADAAH